MAVEPPDSSLTSLQNALMVYVRRQRFLLVVLLSDWGLSLQRRAAILLSKMDYLRLTLLSLKEKLSSLARESRLARKTPGRDQADPRESAGPQQHFN